MEERKNRVFIATGYFHIVAIVATIKTIEKETAEKFNDILILVVDNQDKNTLIKMVKDLYNFSNIFIENRKNVHKLFRYITLDNFIKKGNIHKVHQFFVHCVSEHKMVKNYNYDELFCIYEGRGTLSDSISKSYKDIEYKSIYSLIDIKIKNVKFIDNDIFKDLIGKIAEDSKIIVNNLDDSKEVVILLLNNVGINNSEILKEYQKVIKDIVKKYPEVNLYIKPHPRQVNFNFIKILDIKQHNNIFIFREQFLIETLFQKNIKFLIGHESSALLHSLYLYNIPSFYFNHSITGNVKGALLTSFLIPNFYNFLQSNRSLEDFIKDFRNQVEAPRNSDLFHQSYKLIDNMQYNNEQQTIFVNNKYNHSRKKLKKSRLLSVVLAVIIIILLIFISMK